MANSEPRHGGDIETAQAAFPDAPTPWIDLSTGINPHGYPARNLGDDIWRRLPDRSLTAVLCSAAADYYGSTADRIVPAAGTQALLQALTGLRARGRTGVLTPTYAEHAAVWAAGGHEVVPVSSLSDLGGFDVATVVNPNNPDGRRYPAEALRALAGQLGRRGGWLIVDEAFGDLVPELTALGDAQPANLVVLRSVGKFFGLGGLRLSFLVAAPPVAGAVRRALGPWPVSGPAAVIGARALADRDWQGRMRARLAREARRLDRWLAGAGWPPVGGTDLFRLIDHERADDLRQALGRAGIHVRAFDHQPRWLRIGLPGPADWPRLTAALRPDRSDG